MGWWEDFVDTAVDVYEAVADTVSDVTADAAETAGNLVEDGTNAVGSTFPILAGPLSWFGGVVAGVGNFAGAIIKGVMATSCVIAGGLAKIIGGLFVLNGDLMLKGLVDILSGIGGAILVVIATGWSLFQRTAFPLAKFVWSWFSPPPPWLDTSERGLTKEERDRLHRVFLNSVSLYNIRVIPGRSGVFSPMRHLHWTTQFMF
jgi:hypothetical protein